MTSAGFFSFRASFVVICHLINTDGEMSTRERDPSAGSAGGFLGD